MSNLSIIRAELFHKKNVGTPDQQHELLDRVHSAKSTVPSASNTNDGCWRSDVRYDNLDWLLQEVVALTDSAIEFYKGVDPVFQSTTFKKPYMLNYWTNVNRPGSRNVLHTHSGAHFACVYYLQAFGTGDLRLINPGNIFSNAVFSAPFARDFYFKPTDGDLILWPGWVPHEVEPNLSTKDRINIVFDITL